MINGNQFFGWDPGTLPPSTLENARAHTFDVVSPTPSTANRSQNFGSESIALPYGESLQGYNSQNFSSESLLRRPGGYAGIPKDFDTGTPYDRRIRPFENFFDHTDGNEEHPTHGSPVWSRTGPEVVTWQQFQQPKFYGFMHQNRSQNFGSESVAQPYGDNFQGCNFQNFGSESAVLRPGDYVDSTQDYNSEIQLQSGTRCDQSSTDEPDHNRDGLGCAAPGSDCDNGSDDRAVVKGRQKKQRRKRQIQRESDPVSVTEYPILSKKRKKKEALEHELLIRKEQSNRDKISDYLDRDIYNQEMDLREDLIRSEEEEEEEQEDEQEDPVRYLPNTFDD